MSHLLYIEASPRKARSASIDVAKSFVSTFLEHDSKLNIPFTVGGGISSVEDVDTLLKCGADKVSINSSGPIIYKIWHCNTVIRMALKRIY